MSRLSATAGSAHPAERAGCQRPGTEGFRRDALLGLSRSPRAIPSVWLYDAWGSRLFERIMRLPAYCPTRVETSILEAHAGDVMAALPVAAGTVVDLGAGDGAKTRLLLAAARARAAGVAYAPVDISQAALLAAGSRMRLAWPDLPIRPVQAEYVEGLTRAREAGAGAPLLALLLGSNIGNLEWEEAVALLRDLRRALRPGDHLLVGFDLLKDRAVLKEAYDDPEGVTAAFNLNLLARMNRELDGDFDLGGFAHRAIFDPGRPAMESWLVARRAQVVRVAGRRFAFGAGEALHTEIS